MPGMLKVRAGGAFVPASAGGGGGGGGPDEVWVGPNPPTGAEKIWIDTDEAAPVPSDVRWDTAWGVVAMGGFVGGAGYTVPVGRSRITDFLPFASVVGRRYRMVLQLRVIGATTGNGLNLFPVGPGLGGTSWDVWASASPGYGYVNCEVLFSGSGTAGNYYWDASVTTSIAVYMDTMSTFYIEDVGPVVGSIPAVGSPNTTWTTLTLPSGWAAYGGSYAIPAYRKVGDRVELRGMAATNAPGTSVSTICTLPAGHRPPGTLMFVTWLSANATVYRTAVRVEVGFDGVVSFNHHYGLYGQGATSAPTITAIDHISLDGITFSVTP